MTFVRSSYADSAITRVPGRPRDAPRRVRAAAFRHPDVHERDVGQVGLGDPDRLLGVGGRADQLDPVLVARGARRARCGARARRRRGARGWDRGGPDQARRFRRRPSRGTYRPAEGCSSTSVASCRSPSGGYPNGGISGGPSEGADETRMRCGRPGERADLPVVAAGGRDADADEQPRSRGGRAARGPRRLRRDRSRGAVVGGLRRDRPDAPRTSATTRRCSSSRASPSACSARTSWRRASSSRTRCSCRSGPTGTRSATSSTPG